MRYSCYNRINNGKNGHVYIVRFLLHKRLCCLHLIPIRRCMCTHNPHLLVLGFSSLSAFRSDFFFASLSFSLFFFSHKVHILSKKIILKVAYKLFIFLSLSPLEAFNRLPLNAERESGSSGNHITVATATAITIASPHTHTFPLYNLIEQQFFVELLNK